MKDLVFYFEATENGNVLYANNDNIFIKAEMNIEDTSSISQDYGYITLKNRIKSTLEEMYYEGKLVFPYDGHENKLDPDSKADDEIDITVEDYRKFYRILNFINGSCFESDIYTDPDKVIEDCTSEWDCLTQHDKDRTESCYVAVYDNLEDAEEVLADHDTLYDVKDTWAKNLRNRYSISRKALCNKYDIPYNTYEKWEYGTRECPEYVRTLLERVMREDFR